MAKPERLYTLEVELIRGPVTDMFATENPIVSRTLQVLGSHSLEDLHDAIFDAFERIDDHLYEFRLAEHPDDVEAVVYVMPEEADGHPGQTIGGTTECTIGELGLAPEDIFFYWFDFGDDWWHRITVGAIAEEAPPGDYPCEIDRVGASPPQYPNPEGGDEWDGEGWPDEYGDEDEEAF